MIEDILITREELKNLKLKPVDIYADGLIYANKEEDSLIRYFLQEKYDEGIGLYYTGFTYEKKESQHSKRYKKLKITLDTDYHCQEYES
jgi:hypothetical protein